MVFKRKDGSECGIWRVRLNRRKPKKEPQGCMRLASLKETHPRRVPCE